MNEEEVIVVNDTMRSIRGVAEDLRNWLSPSCDQRIKAMVLTKLEEAELLAQRLVKNP